MPAAATDLEEEDTATDLFFQNACLFSKHCVMNVQTRVSFFYFYFFCFFYSKKKYLTGRARTRAQAGRAPASPMNTLVSNSVLG
jgi:hypothetical protein